MNLELFKRTIIHEKRGLILNTIFLSFLVTISLSLLSISLGLPYQYKEMIGLGKKGISLMFNDKIDFYRLDNDFDFYSFTSRGFTFYIDTNELNLYSGEDLYFVKNDEHQIPQNEIFVSSSFAESYSLTNGETLSVKSLEKKNDYTVKIKEDQNEEMCLNSLEYYNFNITGMRKSAAIIYVETYDDVGKLVNFLDSCDIPISSYSEDGFLGIYNSVKNVESLFGILAILVLIYTALVVYNQMSIFISNSAVFVGILRFSGCTIKNFFINNLFVIMLISFSSVILGSITSSLFLRRVNDLAFQSFSASFDFSVLWYQPIVLAFSMIVIFLLFFGKSIYRKLCKLDVIDVLKREEI